MFQFAQNGRNLVEHRLVPTIHLVNIALDMQRFEPHWLRCESPDATTECKVSICADQVQTMSEVLCHGAGQLQPRVSQGTEVRLGFARAQTLEMGRQPEPEMQRFAVST